MANEQRKREEGEGEREERSIFVSYLTCRGSWAEDNVVADADDDDDGTLPRASKRVGTAEKREREAVCAEGAWINCSQHACKYNECWGQCRRAFSATCQLPHATCAVSVCPCVCVLVVRDFKASQNTLKHAKTHCTLPAWIEMSLTCVWRGMSSTDFT